MRKSLHLGDERRLPVAFVAVEKNTFIAEEVFNPEASLTDGNPFPEEEVVEETTPLEEEGPTDYNSLTVDELRALCRAQDLPVTGKKAELVARLMEADTPSEEATSSDETGSVSNESEPETTNTVG